MLTPALGCLEGKMERKSLFFCIFLFINFIAFTESSDIYIPKEQKNINEYFIFGNEGDIIYSIGDGIVTVGFDNIKGNYIIADYKSLGINVTYCNLKSMCVKKDQKIKKGDKLGTIGITGYTDKTGCSIIIEINKDNFLFQNEN